MGRNLKRGSNRPALQNLFLSISRVLAPTIPEHVPAFFVIFRRIFHKILKNGCEAEEIAELARF